MGDDIKTWDQLADEAVEEGIAAILQHRATWGDCLSVANRCTSQAARIKELEEIIRRAPEEIDEDETHCGITGGECPTPSMKCHYCERHHAYSTRAEKAEARCEALEWLREVESTGPLVRGVILRRKKKQKDAAKSEFQRTVVAALRAAGR